MALLHPLLARVNAEQVMQYLPINDVCATGRTNRAMNCVVSTSPVAWSSPATIELGDDYSSRQLPVAPHHHPCTHLVIKVSGPITSMPLHRLVDLVLLPCFTRVRRLVLVGVSPTVCEVLRPFILSVAPRIEHLVLLQWKSILPTINAANKELSWMLQSGSGSGDQESRLRHLHAYSPFECLARKRSYGRSLPDILHEEMTLGTHMAYNELLLEYFFPGFPLSNQESIDMLQTIADYSRQDSSVLESVCWVGSGGFGDWMAPLEDLGPSVSHLKIDGFAFLACGVRTMSRLRHVRRLELVNCVQRMFQLEPLAPGGCLNNNVLHLTIDHHHHNSRSASNQKEKERLQNILRHFPRITKLCLVQPRDGQEHFSKATMKQVQTSIVEAILGASLQHLAHLDVSGQGWFQIAQSDSFLPIVDLGWTLFLAPPLNHITLGIPVRTPLFRKLVADVAGFQHAWAPARKLEVVCKH